MTRPLRIQFPGALYHVTSRGDRQEPIFDDDVDRRVFLATLGEVVRQANWVCYAYCLMSNHYHLVFKTPDANLAKGMRQLNGVYTQHSNRRHQRTGHLFQGRYHAVLVDGDAYLLALSRYVVLNPVRAGMVKQPEGWPWSSHKAMLGTAAAPPWLEADGLLALFGETRVEARRRYAEFVVEGLDRPSIWKELNQQIYLGSDAFVERMQAEHDGAADEDVNVPQAQRRSPALPLDVIEQQCEDREEAMRAAYASGAYSYQDIAKHFGVHFTTVGRIIRRHRGRGQV